MRLQRLTSMALAGILAISTIPYNVFAASGEITADKGSSQVPAKVTAEAAQFSVTVPAILPIDVSADGTVSTADDVKIVNNSASPVKVTKVSVEAINEWELAEFDSDFTRMRVNEKKFGLQLQTNNVQTDGTCGLDGFTAIPGNGGELPLAYDANLTTQTTAIDHLNIANVTFTIGWDDGTTSDGEDDGDSPGGGDYDDPYAGYDIDWWEGEYTDEQFIEDYSYTTSGGTVIITKYIGTHPDVYVLSTFNGKSVLVQSYRRSGDSGDYDYERIPFMANSVIESITFEDGVKFQEIKTEGVYKQDGTYAFSNNPNLKGVRNIPETTALLNGMFATCPNLVAAPILPDAAEALNSAFFNCSSIINPPIIPDKVTNMNACFSGCTSLKKAPIIPTGVNDLSACFMDCTSLTTSPEIPSNVKTIYNIFRNCTGLKTGPAVIPQSVNDMRWAFLGCSNLTGNMHILSSSVKQYDKCFEGAETAEDCHLYLTGTPLTCNNLASTNTSGRVTVS